MSNSANIATGASNSVTEQALYQQYTILTCQERPHPTDEPPHAKRHRHDPDRSTPRRHSSTAGVGSLSDRRRSQTVPLIRYRISWPATGHPVAGEQWELAAASSETAQLCSPRYAVSHG